MTPRLDFVVSTKPKNLKVTVRRAEGGNLGIARVARAILRPNYARS